MSKFIKRSILILFLTVLVLFGGLILFKWFSNISTNRFDKEIMSNHFKIFYNMSDESCIEDVKNYLENNYQRITTDFKQTFDKPIEVKIYSDLESLHRAINVAVKQGLFFFLQPDVTDDWVVGTSTQGTIRIVSPINSGKSNRTYDDILKVVVHEFTHITTSKIRDSQCSVLEEGIAQYEAGQTDNENVSLKDKLPNSIEEMFSWNNINNSDKTYSIGISFVKFIIEKYGYDRFIEIYKKDYQKDGFDDGIREVYQSWVTSICEDKSNF